MPCHQRARTHTHTRTHARERAGINNTSYATYPTPLQHGPTHHCHPHNLLPIYHRPTNVPISTPCRLPFTFRTHREPTNTTSSSLSNVSGKHIPPMCVPRHLTLPLLLNQHATPQSVGYSPAVATLSAILDSHLGLHLDSTVQVSYVQPLAHQTWPRLELETFGSAHRSCCPATILTSAIALEPVAKQSSRCQPAMASSWPSRPVCPSDVGASAALRIFS